MNARISAATGLAAVMLAAGGAVASIAIETVPVGNPGNAGELSGYDGWGGPERICGSVSYAYHIGKYEVTAGQYTVFLNAVGGVDTYRLYNPTMAASYGCGITRSGGGTVGDPYRYAVAAVFTNRPVSYVNWGDAARFANWLHNDQPTGAQGLSTTEDGAYYLNGTTGYWALQTIPRKAGAKWAIPSEDEWYKAAYYDPATSSYYDFPTRSNTQPGRDLADASGNNANYYQPGSPYPIQSPYTTTVVGEFQNSYSPYGTFDQGGNVAEWTEAMIPDPVIPSVLWRGLRGGEFMDGSNFLQAREREREAPDSEQNLWGFRVALVPEPATIILIGLGAVGIVSRRKSA